MLRSCTISNAVAPSILAVEFGVERFEISRNLHDLVRPGHLGRQIETPFRGSDLVERCNLFLDQNHQERVELGAEALYHHGLTAHPYLQIVEALLEERIHATPRSNANASDLEGRLGLPLAIAGQSSLAFYSPFERMKVKVRHEGVFVVGGIRDVNAFDGVLDGERVGDELRYRGIVEWGFRAPDVLALLEHARRWSRPGSPFVGAPWMRSVTWVEPRLEAEVSYAEIVEGRLRAVVAAAPAASDHGAQSHSVSGALAVYR
jgi:hypothetical protein